MLHQNGTVFHLKCDTVEFEYGLTGAEASINYVTVVALSLAVLPTVCLNLATGYVFSCKETRRQIPTNILILGTCVVDFLSGLISLPLVIT